MLIWLAALATPLLLILTFPGFNLAWLAPVALAPLLFAAAVEDRPWRRFFMGWAAGIVYWFGICYWIQFVLSVHGGMGEGAGWAVFLLFCLAKGLHLAVFTCLAGWLMRGEWWAMPGVAALWTAVEATHGSLGFAWLALGNAAIDMDLPLRLAPYTGVWGISFFFALASAGIVLAILRRPRRDLAWLVLLPMVALLPALPKAERGERAALLVQPNLSETEEWTSGSLDRMEKHLADLSLRNAAPVGAPAASIVIWPEMPAPLYYERDPQLRDYVNTLARTLRTSVLTGVVAGSDGAPLNSAQLVSPEGKPVSRYDKVNLVPFGEFVPWPFGFVNKISGEVGDFQPGKDIVLSPLEGHKTGTFICYESVFPSYVRRFVASGAEVLFNISNDGYFGRSAARSQHLAIARMRAVENRRWLLRATNSGTTATIDPAGRVRSTLAGFREGVSYTGFQYIREQTMYTLWGDWFGWLCALLAAAGFAADRFL